MKLFLCAFLIMLLPSIGICDLKEKSGGEMKDMSLGGMEENVVTANGVYDESLHQLRIALTEDDFGGAVDLIQSLLFKIRHEHSLQMDRYFPKEVDGYYINLNNDIIQNPLHQLLPLFFY